MRWCNSDIVVKGPFHTKRIKSSPPERIPWAGSNKKEIALTLIPFFFNKKKSNRFPLSLVSRQKKNIAILLNGATVTRQQLKSLPIAGDFGYW